MLAASRAYKQQMEQYLRNHSYCRVTIGAINQLAQKSISVSSDTAYISNNSLLFNGYAPEISYATMEQNWFRADGSMFFPPRQSGSIYLYNQGAVAENIGDPIVFSFPISYDIKGLTIDFSDNYPVDFTISNGTNSYTYTGNNSSHFVSPDIFDGTTELTITPITMVNGEDRLRIGLFYCGLGIQFTNRKLQSVQKQETVSPVTSSLPTTDLSVQIENYDNAWDVSNSSSSINYLETGQEVQVEYGYELNDGAIYWMDGCKCLLSSWNANSQQMSFNAEDRLATLTDTYYGGEFYSDGIDLYSLALLVLNDAEVDDRDYLIDTYLQSVIVYNPLPAVSHAECLQIIANCARCKLYTDRQGRIRIAPAFEMEIDPGRMTITTDDATEFSDIRSVLDVSNQIDYAMMTQDYFVADSSMYFLPRGSNYLTAGFVSQQISDASGNFSDNPSVTIQLEAAATFFALGINFSANPPKSLTIHSYLNGELQESYVVTRDFSLQNEIEHEFPRMDSLTIEFVKTVSNNRIYLNHVNFGEQTDFSFNRTNMIQPPTGTRTTRVKDVQVLISTYSSGTELQGIASETIDVTGIDTYTFYLSTASHGFSATIDGSTALSIVDASAYFVSVNVSLYSGVHQINVNGYSYNVSQSVYTNQINSTGTTETWENPLISTATQADLVAEWLGDYFYNNATYDIQYRGEPRLDASDYAFMDNDYVPKMMVQITSHTLNFNGALSGTVEARLARGGE